MPPQFDFVFRKWAQEIKADPSLGEQEPYKSLIEKDPAFLEALGVQDPKAVEPLLTAFTRSWAGTAPEEFDAQVREWLRSVKQPKLGVPYVELVYKPMLELLDLLKAHEFRVFVSLRRWAETSCATFAEETWGIYKENVIGTAAEYQYRDGKVVRGERVLGEPRCRPRASPSTSLLLTGRLPVFGGGATPMWTSRCSAPRPSPVLDQPRRRRARVRLHQRRPRKPSQKAKELGWTVVSMKNRLEHRLLERGKPHERPDCHRHPDQPRRRPRSSEPKKSTRGCSRACPKDGALDDTHKPHITTLQRYVRTTNLDKVYDAVEETMADNRHGRALVPSHEHHSTLTGASPATRPDRAPGQGQPQRCSTSKPSSIAAVEPFVESDGTPRRRSSLTPAEESAPTIIDWVEKSTCQPRYGEGNYLPPTSPSAQPNSTT